MNREYGTSSNVVVSPSLSEVFRKNLPRSMKKGLLSKKKNTKKNQMVANQFCYLGKNRFLIKINPWSYNVLPKQEDY